MERFTNIVNIWKQLIIFTKSSILDVWLGSNSKFAFLHYTFHKRSFLAMCTSRFVSMSVYSGNTQKSKVLQLFQVIISSY